MAQDNNLTSLERENLNSLHRIERTIIRFLKVKNYDTEKRNAHAKKYFREHKKLKDWYVEWVQE